MSGCPVHRQNDPSTNMPPAEILQSPVDEKASRLPTDRLVSSIPRTSPDPNDGSSRWMYPSPRMFHNALARKGKGVDAADVDSMVQVHNWLNEQVWMEVERWEKNLHSGDCPCGPTLKRFMGRPDDLSPRAWFYHKLMGGIRPFDRHDWTVERCGREVRYVIDYYEAGKDGDGMPVFSVDVRPALDTVGAIFDRMRMAWHSFTQP